MPLQPQDLSSICSAVLSALQRRLPAAKSFKAQRSSSNTSYSWATPEKHNSSITIASFIVLKELFQELTETVTHKIHLYNYLQCKAGRILPDFETVSQNSA